MAVLCKSHRWKKNVLTLAWSLLQDAIEAFHRISTPPGKLITPSRPTKTEVESKKLPVFLNGRALRSYQEESLRWMLNNYRGGQGRNLQWEPRACILGDEVGHIKVAAAA